MAKMHRYSGIKFWLIKALFKFNYSGIKVYFTIGQYFPNDHIDQVGRVFDNGPGDQGSILGHTKDSKKWYLIDVSLLNTQH